MSAGDPIEAAVHHAARDLMVRARWPVAELRERLKPVPGLYGVYGDPTAWEQLNLPFDAEDSQPLYVGKAEDSFVSRDLRTHFASGRTGQSTVRRSFAALLHDSLDLRGVPRNVDKPAHFSNFGLTVEDDARLTQWMWSRLSLTVWPWDGVGSLKEIERGVVQILDPPLNIEYVPRAARRDLSAARKVMADEARRWTQA